uniref:Neuronal cell adhesion molecule n=1 Tax=Scleropages formosus TaxID=113540 RepID=A0A8C9W9N5_SCLFO
MGKHTLRGGVVLLFFLGHTITALEVPLDLPQPPTITHQSPKDYIIDPRENIVIYCEAKGKPHPSFSWTRNGTHFDIDRDPKVIMKPSSGTLVIDISGEKAEAYEGIYQCMARNEHGTAVSNNIVIRQSRSPLWAKERNEPIIVQEGVSLVLPCRPPAGLPPPIIFWMDNSKLPQSSRVSQALNGDLYFSNVQMEDTRSDYICYARFPHTQTIQQKQPITVNVLNNSPAGERPPKLMVPHGTTSTAMVLRGEVLELECIAEGLPTPEITWRKESGELPSDRVSFLSFQKTLRISDVTEADAGGYRCTAMNRLGSMHHIITVTVEAAPYWISAPTNLILAPKETGVLICRASGNPKPTITWSMNGIPIESKGSPNHNRKVEDDSIIFTHVQAGSSAVYQCNASNEFGYLLGNAFVNVLAEPPRMLTPPNKIYQVITNSPALLDCANFGSPIPKVTWFKDSQTSVLDGDPYVQHKNGTLEIHVAQKANSGKYTCVAMNSLGKTENSVHLEVKEPTRILKQPEYKVAQRNQNVVFECKVKHDPTLIPTMIWQKDNQELPDDERFVVDADSLTINDVTEVDAGTYTCIMNTTLDQDSASAMLTVVGTSFQATPTPAIVYEQPDPPTDLELTDPQQRSVQLTWVSGDDNNSPIQKFIIQYEDALHEQGVWHNLTEVPGTKSTAQLKLSPYVHYTFRVLALNEVGLSKPSSTSRQYKTDPAAPEENPSGVEAEGTERDNLVISWKPLTGLQSNGPGLQYKVMWRQKDVETDWNSVRVANVSKFVVSGTKTFVPYEVKVQAVNDYGSSPEPEAVLGYSGEDFPGNPEFVRVTNPTLDSLTVVWGPPKEPNGRLTGYTLRYQPSESSHCTLLPFLAKATYLVGIFILLPILKFETPVAGRFYINANTVMGSGATITEEGVTVIDEGKLQPCKLYGSQWHSPRHIYITLLVMSIIQLLYPTFSLMFPSTKIILLYRFSLLNGRQVDIATQGWFIGLMCAIALLILVLLIACFIKRNKGGKYPVKEKEDAHADPEIQPMKEDDGTFGEYSDTEDHKPLKGSRTPSNGTVKKDDSDDSLVDYGEGGDGQFNEDGSFIGQYSGRKERDTAEGNESSEAPSPVNAMNSFV